MTLHNWVHDESVPRRGRKFRESSGGLASRNWGIADDGRDVFGLVVFGWRDSDVEKAGAARNATAGNFAGGKKSIERGFVVFVWCLFVGAINQILQDLGSVGVHQPGASC